MGKPAVCKNGTEFYCLSILLGECAGVVYVIGTTMMQVLNLW
jgi:hypothetical protein